MPNPIKKRKKKGSVEGDLGTTPVAKDFLDLQKRMDIVDRKIQGESIREIALAYNVSRQWIHRIIQSELEKLNAKAVEGYCTWGLYRQSKRC